VPLDAAFAPHAAASPIVATPATVQGRLELPHCLLQETCLADRRYDLEEQSERIAAKQSIQEKLEANRQQHGRTEPAQNREQSDDQPAKLIRQIVIAAAVVVLGVPILLLIFHNGLMKTIAFLLFLWGFQL